MDECLWQKEGSVQDETVVRVSELTETTQKEKEKKGGAGLEPRFFWMDASLLATALTALFMTK